MSQFIYPVGLLSKNKTIYFEEFTNKAYKNFVKTILGNSNETFEMFVNQLLTDICVTDIDVKNLSNIDKLYILLAIRAYNISPAVKFVAETKPEKDKKPSKVSLSLDLNTLLTKLEKYNLRHFFTVKDKGIVVKCMLPKHFFFKTVMDVIYDCIIEVTFHDKYVSLIDVDNADKVKFINSLPSTILTYIVTILHEQNEKLKEDPFILFNTNKELTVNKQISLSLFDNSVSEIIKLVFNTSLRDFYVNEYTLVRRFKFTHDAICNLTPAETSLYHDIISKDVEKEKKEMDEQQNQQQMSTSNMPSMPVAPKI